MSANATVIFADSHCGYLYREYPQRAHRLEHTRQALMALAEFLHDVRGQVSRLICVGDLVEKLYPTSQTSFELAQAQLEPLGIVLRREGWPLVYVAGNCDPYYDPHVQRRLAMSFAHPPDKYVMSGAVGALLGGAVHLHLPGLCYLDQEETGLLFTHGHLFDQLIGSSLRGPFSQVHSMADMVRNGLFGKVTAGVGRHLRRCEWEHRWLGSVYEHGCWWFSWLPRRWGRAVDAKLAASNISQQACACFQASKDVACNGIVAGHIHVAGIRRDAERCRTYLNPGTLTSAFKIHASRSQCTFAMVIAEPLSITIELFQCHESGVRSIGTEALRRVCAAPLCASITGRR